MGTILETRIFFLGLYILNMTLWEGALAVRRGHQIVQQMPNLVAWANSQYIKGAGKTFVCLCLQSEWFIWGLTSPPGVAPLSSGVAPRG